MSVAVIQRTTFSTSRPLEFCSAKELVDQTGHEPDDWPLVILKELIDNALDACEEAGIAPAIRVTVARGRSECATTGPVSPPRRSPRSSTSRPAPSSREAYVAPDRGQQGNALKTIIGHAVRAERRGRPGRDRRARHPTRDHFRVDRIAQRR